MVFSVAATVAAVVAPIVATIAAVIAPVVATIGSIISAITSALAGTVAEIGRILSNTVISLVSELGNAIETIVGAIDYATAPILNPIKDGLSLVHAKLKAIDAWVAAELTIVHDAIQIASAAATVKLLIDLIKGQASISELIAKVAEGKSFETAVAIAQLSKSIITMGVGIVDNLDVHWKLIETTYKTWDDEFKKELRMAVDIQKAELLGIMTPKLVVLGDTQLKTISAFAKLSRHLEDEAWFGAMLIKLLR